MRRNVASLMLLVLLLTLPAGCAEKSAQKTPCPTSTADSTVEQPVIAFLGDSITHGVEIRENYVKLLGEQLGVPVQNAGFPGSTMAKITRESTYKGHSYVERLEELDAGVEYVFVMGGTNDYGSDVDQATPLGELDSTDETTFYGALKYIIQGIKEQCPNATLIFATPLRRSDEMFGYPEGGCNEYGLTLADYCTAILEVCAEKEIPCIDLYHEFTLYDPEDFSFEQLTKDGLHPNEAGHKALADFLLPLLQEYMKPVE